MSVRVVVACICLLWAALPARAQQGADPDINRYIAKINSGQIDEVKRELPSLLSKYPNNPGVLYLQGMTTSEGSEAVRIYQSIVDNFPRSEWADDALYRVYQFYYALGLYRTAEIKMNQLKKEYPESKYLAANRPDTKTLPEEPAAIASSAPVEPPVDAPADSTPAVTQQPAARSAEPLSVQYVLQVGAYTAQANAEKQKQFFQTLGYPVEVISKEKDSRSLFLVWVGSYRSYDDAKREGTKIKQKYNLGSIVISR